MPHVKLTVCPAACLPTRRGIVNGGSLSVSGENELEIILFPFVIPFHYEIVAALTGHNAHVFLLYQFEHAQEGEDGFDPVFTMFEKAFK